MWLGLGHPGTAAPDGVDVKSDPNAIQKMRDVIEKVTAQESGGEIKDDEILVFPGSCSSCYQPLDTLMKKFNTHTSRYDATAHIADTHLHVGTSKDIPIMLMNCDACGYQDNEAKSGSAISEKEKRITLKVEGRGDLSQDILKVLSEPSPIGICQLFHRAKLVGSQYQKSNWCCRLGCLAEDSQP